VIEPARNTPNAKSFLAINSIEIGEEIELFALGYLKGKSLMCAVDGNPSQSDQQGQ
jgi:hypothetical protein